jgi:hypothetical protein
MIKKLFHTALLLKKNWKMSTKYYSVCVSEYAKRHFIKVFDKKYKTWNNTLIEIKNMLSRIDMFILSSKAEKIHICDV